MMWQCVPCYSTFVAIIQSEAAASTAPAALNALEFVISMETGYFHSMNLAHPVSRMWLVQCTLSAFHDHPVCQSSCLGTTLHRGCGQCNIPQYANFRPKYFPTYGHSTIVSSSSSCCNDSCHSRSASDIASSSEGETEVLLPAEDEGSESISSSAVGSGCCIEAYDEEGLDIVERREEE